MISVGEDSKGYTLFTKKDNSTGDKITSLDHPYFLEKMNEIQTKHESTKYFTYRCAGKIFDITNELLRTNLIPYQLVLGILDRHRMQNTSVLSPKLTKEVVFEIYYAAYRLGYLPVDQAQGGFESLELCKYSLLSLIWNIFDSKRMKPSIPVSDFKQLMLILCESSCYQSKLYEYFDLVCDYNQLVSRTKFESMCLCFARIFAYIDSSANQFGLNFIENTVDDSYKHLHGLCGLTQLQFFELWNSSSSIFAAFANIVALIQRLGESQLISHEKMCVGCGTAPIIGLRFKCQQCRNFSLCLKCFSTGFTNGKHSTSHKMYEISSNETKKYFTFGKFFSKLCSMGDDDSMASKEMKIEETRDNGEINQSIVKISSQSMKRGTVNKSTISNWTEGRTLSRSTGITASTKIFKIIDSLSDCHETLLNNLNNFKSNLNEDQINILKHHCDVLQKNIKELRDCGPNPIQSVPFSSTPFRSTTHNTKKRTPLLNTSAPLFHSIRGAEINKTFVEENKSLSINDISNWFQLEKEMTQEPTQLDDEKITTITKADTKMTNFRKLLCQVKEICDDSYSDNSVLADKTKKLESALDDIIANEEEKRSQKHG
uniref:CSON000726 protein n=1 Tax=Culicoides sonorensis TaxID=179676 RepID=A0A336MJ39_CULSO